MTYKYTPTAPDMPYSRSRAFNEGARLAGADCLIFHDNDLLIPTNYAEQTYKHYQAGFEFVNLKRFIFYLSECSSELVLANKTELKESPLSSIMQNAEGGGSIGASKSAFIEIGGFDERFVGWGGEDNEFWERAQTKKVWPYAYLPLIHLWHPDQPEKLNQDNSKTRALYKKLSKQNPRERIKALTNE